MSPTSYQTAPSRDILVPEAGVEPVRECFSRDFKSRASANSAIPAFCDLLVPHCLYIIALLVQNVNTFFHFFENFRFLYWHAPQNVVSYISGFRGGCVLSYAARRRFMHRHACKNAFSAKCLTKLNTWIIAQFCIVIGIFRLCRRYSPRASMRNTNFKKYAGLFRRPPNVANRIRLRRATSNAHVFNKISYAGLSKWSQRGGLENR